MFYQFALILFLSCANAFFNKEHVKTHCIFSKHMLNVFELNEKYFLLKYPRYVRSEYKMEDLKEYAKNLVSQSSVIMIMLDELRMKNSSYYPADLMTVNLYLNNVRGHIYMSQNNMPYTRNGVITKEERLREGFKTYYNYITRLLTNFINSECRNFGLCFAPIERRFQHLVISSREWATDDGANYINLVKAAIDKLKDKSYAVFKENMSKISYTEFHPSNMLFFNIMNPYSKFEKQPVADDGLNLMRHVKVKTTGDKNRDTNIINLYENVLLNFDGYYVKSYQQQVLVATVYPVFECICTYVSVFNLLFHIGYTFKPENEKKITTLGSSLVEVIRQLVHSNIFKYEVNQYVSALLRELDNYNWFGNTNWSTKIIPDIKYVLTLNRLEFDAEKYNIPIKLLKDDECQNLLDKTGAEIEKTKNYVQALIAKKQWYQIVKNTVDHSHIFHNAPLNVMSAHVMGSLNPFNINTENDSKVNVEETPKVVDEHSLDKSKMKTFSDKDDSVASQESNRKGDSELDELENNTPDTTSHNDYVYSSNNSENYVPSVASNEEIFDGDSFTGSPLTHSDLLEKNSGKTSQNTPEQSDVETPKYIEPDGFSEKKLFDESQSFNVRVPDEEVPPVELPLNKKYEGKVSKLSKLFNDLVEKNSKEQNYSQEMFKKSIEKKTKKFVKFADVAEKLSDQYGKNEKSEQSTKVSEDEVKQLHCLFSKYILKFLTLNEKLFTLNNYDSNGQRKFGMINLLNYDSNIRSQSQYVLAMLDELRILKKSYFAVDLMTVNLYLNNIQDNLNVIVSSENVGESQYSATPSKEEIIRNKYIKNYDMTVEYLTKSINDLCGSSCKNIDVDYRYDELRELLKNSDNEATYNDPKQILAELHLMKYQSLATFKKSINRDSIYDYHPTKMMFYDLMTSDVKMDKSSPNSISTNGKQTNEAVQRNKAESNYTENGLNVLRGVIINSNQKSITKNTILDAFYCISSNYRAEYLKSFQQQVLAATVYPIFKSISKYLIAYEQMYDVNDKVISQVDQLLKIGDSLRENFRKFVNLFILPEKANDYLLKVLHNFENILNSKSNNSSNQFKDKILISDVLALCSKPMLLNRLEFNVKDKPDKSLSVIYFNILLNELNNEVNKIRNYVAMLSLRRYSYTVILRSVPHDDMFENEPLDILDKCGAD